MIHPSIKSTATLSYPNSSHSEFEKREEENTKALVIYHNEHVHLIYNNIIFSNKSLQLAAIAVRCNLANIATAVLKRDSPRSDVFSAKVS